MGIFECEVTQNECAMVLGKESPTIDNILKISGDWSFVFEKVVLLTSAIIWSMNTSDHLYTRSSVYVSFAVL